MDVKERRYSSRSTCCTQLSGGEFDRASCSRQHRRADGLGRQAAVRYMDDKRAKEDKLFDHPELMKSPIVRNGKQGPPPAPPRRVGNVGIKVYQRSGMLSAEG